LIDLNAAPRPAAHPPGFQRGDPIMRIDPLPTGLAFGAVIALAHLVWAALVAVGWAQPLIDFILWLHFLNVPVQVAPFEWARAGLLAVVTFLLSFPFGAAFAVIWNQAHPRPALSVEIG
jgi:hypothetical protein